MPSSVIASYSYDKNEQLLHIVFISGTVYRYKKVPAPLFESFKHSGSKGIYFNRFIKHRFEFERIK